MQSDENVGGNGFVHLPVFGLLEAGGSGNERTLAPEGGRIRGLMDLAVLTLTRRVSIVEGKLRGLVEDAKAGRVGDART